MNCILILLSLSNEFLSNFGGNPKPLPWVMRPYVIRSMVIFWLHLLSFSLLLILLLPYWHPCSSNIQRHYNSRVFAFAISSAWNILLLDDLMVWISDFTSVERPTLSILPKVAQMHAHVHTHIHTSLLSISTLQCCFNSFIALGSPSLNCFKFTVQEKRWSE